MDGYHVHIIVGHNNTSKKLVFYSIMIVGQFALKYDSSGDFYFIKEENTEEYQT